MARVAALRYWRARDAQVVVEAWKRSGEGVRAFAERHGIHPRRLSRWARDVEEATESVRFHRVRVVQGSDVEHHDGAPLEIVLDGGLTVRVLPGFAAEDLGRVLEVLGVGAGC